MCQTSQSYPIFVAHWLGLISFKIVKVLKIPLGWFTEMRKVQLVIGHGLTRVWILGALCHFPPL